MGQLIRLLRPFLTKSKLKAVLALSAKVTGTLFGLLFNILLARALGAGGIGIYFLALTVISVGATVARLGLDMASLRFASIANSENDIASLTSLYRQNTGLVILTGTVITALIYYLIPYIPLGGDNAGELSQVLYVIVFALIPLAFIRIQGQFYKAIGEPGKAIFIQTALLQLFLLILTVAFLLTRGQINVHDVAIIYVTAASLTLLLPAIFWLKRYPQTFSLSTRFDTRLLVKTSLPLLWVASMGLVFNWTDTLLLGYWTDTDTVGIYGVASRISAMVMFVLLAVNSVTAPRFASMHAKNNIDGMEKLAQNSTRWMILIISPVVAILVLVPDLILSLFGKDFTEGADVLRILAIGQLINVSVGTVGAILMMSGHGKVVRNNTVFAACLNLIGNIVLIPILGATGAAISTSVSIILQNLILYRKVKTILGINMAPASLLRKE